MAPRTDPRTPLLLWPVVAIWRLVTFVLELTGRILCAVLGLVLVGTGVALTLTFFGAPLGIPVAVFGSLLIARAIF